LVNGDTVSSVGLSSAGAGATATVAGSPYSIVPSGAAGTGLGNYTISYVNGTLTVNAAALTVTAGNQTKTYGQSLSLGGTAFSASGLVNGDSVSSVTLTSSGAAATASVSGSPYNIVPAAAAGTGLANYTITYANGTLAVSRATLTVTADNLTKNFGQTLTFAGTEFTTTGLLNNDSVTSVTLTSSGAAASASVTGSPYSIVPGSAVGNGLANYTIAYVNGTLTVTSSPVIQSATQNGTTFSFTWISTIAQMYQAQYATNLSQSNWANLGSPIIATNSTTSVSDSINGKEKFYRVVLLP